MSSCMCACMHGVGQYHAGDTGESLISSAKSIENALLLFILDSGPMHYIGYSYTAYSYNLLCYVDHHMGHCMYNL